MKITSFSYPIEKLSLYKDNIYRADSTTRSRINLNKRYKKLIEYLKGNPW